MERSGVSAIAADMTKARAAIRTILNLLAMGITLIPLGVALAALSQSEHRWPDLANHFVAPALLACVAWAGLLALLRLRPSALFATFTAVMLTVAVWPQWFPAQAKADAESETITVYSANLWARNTDVAAMAASIAEADPDIVLLVEVGEAPAADLDILLPDHPHREVSIVGNRNVAPARALVASRWPIKPIKENTKDQLFSASARITTPLGRIGFMAAHLTRPWPYRYQHAQITQAEDLAIAREKLGDDAIIAGDFNSVSSGRIGRQIQQSTGMIPAGGFPGTWPAKVPSPVAITIDQVWHSPELVVVERKLGRRNGSDHRPVITRFQRARSVE